jgi:murein DD-endopeptidase MepM/ murein hydrolase activator NlpD
MRFGRIVPFFAVFGACAAPSPVVVIPVPLQGAEAGAAVSRPAPPSPPEDGSLTAPVVNVPRTPADALFARHIRIPVAGATSRQMRDSFDDDRDAGVRKHNAIDILAPRGTPILAADDGHVLRLSTSTLGGITVYAADESERFVYYYAHLDRYHPAMKAGRTLAKGDTIGFVGTTGNAPKDTPHLHFQVMLMPDDGKYWMGEPINPYPFLTGAR